MQILEEKIKEELNQALKDITARYPGYYVECDFIIRKTKETDNWN